ncbi:hypothetical protein M011DRAFT_401002 [Sporormia fimetaria CBS 119925]|uniref:CSN8/PSMD8/EIF3K domain-containing protein n=1 Tax=Sporormia fimetaria CBS 119925 TaxID=1340428 RepID=A0A6A6VBK9_9PLEO|nr:hypothetical protein M011DRAFT_401002 [Sporormia fimetaria CBS 119925]
MKGPDRPNNRRGASGAWNRLKPLRDDSLEAYGLPSKGETRLNDFNTQETYYNRIVERYMRFCASTNNTSDLDASFASLSLSSTASTKQFQSSNPELNHQRPLNPSPSNDLPAILNALRKLREAITATARKDVFAQRAYIFNIRVAILCKDWESYIPALLHLLNTIHPKTPLSATEVHDYVGYLILDQVCRQGDFGGAHETRLRYRYKDRRVQLVLRALVMDNWVVFWKMKRAVDGYQRRIMEYAEQRMRLHALKCLGKSYMSADRGYIERVADKGWAALVEEDSVGWELKDTDRVIIRKPKSK